MRTRGCSRKAHVAAAVEQALVAFGGTRGPKPSDEAIWAAIAWRIGYANFVEEIYDAQSEMRQMTAAVDNPAAFFQEVLNRDWPKEVR